MRSQQHLDLSLARFNAQLQGKPAASAAAPKGGGGSKGGIAAPKPAKVTAAEVKRADAVKQGQEASRQVDVLLDDLSKNYENLHKMDGAISDPKKGLLPNLRAYAESSPPGQLVGRAVGSKAQGERDKITSTKPLLMASIAKATGVKATQLNSNRELEFYLNAATDPNKNIEVNREAIMRLREMFGSAENIAKFRSQFPADALEGGAPAGNGGGGALSAEEQKELEELRKRFKK
jgi:cell division septum initiation protein DivIVA